MAEFLIRVKNKKNLVVLPNAPVLDTKLLQRGDVVVVVRDGWAWSDIELSNPDWRIVKSPGMSLAEAQTYLVPEPGLPASRMLQRRAFKFDINAVTMPASFSQWLADDSRLQPILTVSAAVLRALRAVKAPIPDPTVIS